MNWTVFIIVISKVNFIQGSVKSNIFRLPTNSITEYFPFNICKRYNKGFAAAMADALEKLEQSQELKKQQKEEANQTTKEINKLKRNLKRRKWIDWKTEDEEKGDIKRAPFDPAERVKRKKTAILLGYSGSNYFGMQRNPGMQTIEEELFKAMLKHKWVTEEMFEQAQIACFQRAARTDKGVSAARQVCSLKLRKFNYLLQLNFHLHIFRYKQHVHK